MNGPNLNPQTAVRIEEFLKQLTKDELRYLNRMVVDRLKLLSQLDTVRQMTNFTLGERVEFDDGTGGVQRGNIIKMNKKTVSILTDTARRWNVHPSFLRRTEK